MVMIDLDLVCYGLFCASVCYFVCYKIGKNI